MPNEPVMVPMLRVLQLPPLALPAMLLLLLPLVVTAPASLSRRPFPPKVPRLPAGPRHGGRGGVLMACGGSAGILRASSESEWHSEDEEEESVSMNSRDLGVILVLGPRCFLLSCFKGRKGYKGE